MWQQVEIDQSAHSEVRNAPPHDHAVHVYADDFAISQELVRFIEDGLALGESVVVAVNNEHRESITRWRCEHPPIGNGEILLVADAAETLQTFMVAGMPDPQLFRATVSPLMEQAACGGRRVRVFGEMVALLWADGNVTGALALETLWNEMAANRRFFLLCAYPEVLLGETPLHAVNAMCDRHSDLSLLGHLTECATSTTATRFHARRLLLPIPAALPAARQVATRTLVDWGLSHLIWDCVRVTSELAATALKHAESSFRLTLSRDAARLRIAVEDAANPPFEPSRRELPMVESLASDWGCDVTPDGTTVWAELPL